MMPKSNGEEDGVPSRFPEAEQSLVYTSSAFTRGDGGEEGDGGHNEL